MGCGQRTHSAVVQVTLRYGVKDIINSYVLENSILCKQILAQQPGIVRTFPSGISRQICFFSEVDLSDQCPQPSFT
jgi:hypothetical protein